MIVAAVLLIGGGVVWYLITQFDVTDAGSPLTTEQGQITRFVEACLAASAQDVFVRIGEQGGYVNPIRDGIPSLPGASTEGPAFEAFSGITVPYWSYMSSPNDCQECVHASQQPPLEGTSFPAIEYQAATEIQLMTLQCLDDFTDFAGQYTVTPLNEPLVSVVFGESDIAIALDYSLRVQGAGGESMLERFQTSLDIPLRRLYEAADDIRRQADSSGYFEGRALEEITLASVDDGAPIPPPQGGLDIGYDPGPFWTKVAVEPLVFETVERGTLMTQLFGSRDADFIATGNPAHDNLYLQYYIFTDRDYNDVQANFLYFTDWGGYVNINPSRGQLIRPEVMSSGIPFIPNVKRMDFQYDVSYPVLVQLRAQTRTDEFLFQFPIEVNLRRNNPTKFTPVSAVPELQDICDPESANGPPVLVTTQDQDANPLAANVRFECVNAACPFGETSGGALRAQLPACLQGVIIAEREGYLTAETLVDATGTAPITAEITLQKLTTMEVQLVGLQLVKESVSFFDLDFGLNPTTNPLSALPASVDREYRWVYSGEQVAITANQTAIVEIEPQGFGESQFIVVPAQDMGRTTMDLAPGEYAVRVFIIENLDGPKELKGEEICGGGFAGIGQSCETIPDVTLGEPSYTDPETGETYDTGTTGIPVGGLTWDDTTKLITISQNDLAAGRLQIPVIVIDINSLTKVLDLQVYEQVDALSMDLSLIPVAFEE